MKRKYNFNQTAFTTIDTQEKAYWLGFIFGDGSVTKASLILEISNKDLDHLYKFKKFMLFDGPIIETRKNCSLLRLNSVKLTQDLFQYSLMRPKILKTPNIDKLLLPHFYRGFIDADGWIAVHKHRKSKNSYEYGACCSNQQFLLDMQKYISSKLNRDCGYISLHTNPLGSVYQLIFGGNKLFPQITNIIYADANYYLDRKYNIMKQAIETIKSTPDGRTTRWQNKS